MNIDNFSNKSLKYWDQKSVGETMQNNITQILSNSQNVVCSKVIGIKILSKLSFVHDLLKLAKEGRMLFSLT